MKTANVCKVQPESAPTVEESNSTPVECSIVRQAPNQSLPQHLYKYNVFVPSQPTKVLRHTSAHYISLQHSQQILGNTA